MEGGWPDCQRAGPAARHPDRRLHSSAGGRPQAPRGGSFSRRLAGHREAHCGIGHRRMRLAFGCRPEDMIAAIGPVWAPAATRLAKRCFRIRVAVPICARTFSRGLLDGRGARQIPMLFLTQRAPGHSPIGPELHLNLVEANRRQLLAAGLSPAPSRRLADATSCQPEAVLFAPRLARARRADAAVIRFRPPPR